MSNFGELQDHVLEHQLNDTKYRPSVKRWLNEAQDKIALRFDFREFFTPTDFETEAGSAAYELPSDFLRLVYDENTNSVADATDPDNWVPMAQMTLREFDDMSVTTGAPRLFAIAGNVLYLAPTPDAVYSIALIYYRKAQAMEAISDEPELATHWHDLLEYYALVRAFERENDYQAAEYWQNRYETESLKAAAQAQHDTRDQNRIVPGTWGDPGYVTTGGGGTGVVTGGDDGFGGGTFGS